MDAPMPLVPTAEPEEPARFAVIVGQARFTPETDTISLLEFAATPLLVALLTGLRNAATAPEEHSLPRIDNIYARIADVPIVAFNGELFADQELYVLELQFAVTAGVQFDTLLDGLMQAADEFRRWRAQRRAAAAAAAPPELKRAVMIVLLASPNEVANQELAHAANRIRPGATDTAYTYARAPPPGADSPSMWPVLSLDLLHYLELWADYVRFNLERPLAARVAARRKK